MVNAPRSHAAMTLVYLAIAFACGILTGFVLRSEDVLSCAPPAQLFPLLAALLLAALLVVRRHPLPRRVAGILLFLALGVWRYSVTPFDPCFGPADLAYWQSEEGVWVTVEGVVAGYPQRSDRGIAYDLAVEELTLEGQTSPTHGRARVEAASYPVYHYGERLRVRGLLLAPPVSDDFNYRRYLAGRGVRSLMRRPSIDQLDSGGGSPFWRGLYAVRDRASAVIDRILPEPAASLTNGMVLGIEGGIPQKVDDAFKATGTSHLIVISGSNIAFLAGALTAALAGFLSRRRVALVAAPLILIYVLLVGADPPALRAGVIGLLGLGAVYFGRRGAAYVSLCAAGLIIVALNPLTLWDIGFQLSFLTSLGLILFSRPLGSALLAFLRLHLPIQTAKRVTRVLDGTLIVTVAAQATVLPLILLYFGRLSPVSLVTNFLVLPVQPAILAGGIAALLAGLAWQPLGQAVGVIPWLFLTYTWQVVKATAAIPFASVDVGRVGTPFVIAYYVLLIVAFRAPHLARFFRRSPDMRRAGALSALFVVPICLTLFAWRVQPDGRLRIVYVPGEGGEAAVVIAPNGRTAWVWDGKGDGEALADSSRRGGWVRGKPDISVTRCEANPWKVGPCVDPAMLGAGARLVLAEGVELTRLDTASDPALLLTHGEFRTVLPATLSQETLRALPAPVAALKLPAPGTGAWPSVSFLQGAQPQLALWPLETTYPPTVSEYLKQHLTTARIEPDAPVEIVTDGEGFWIIRHSRISPR
jgi:competence protein ComEC